MALVKCSACEHEVSAKAFECPHCGHPIRPTKKKSGCSGCFLILLIGILFAIYAPIFTNTDSSVSDYEPREYISESCNQLSKIFKGNKLTNLQKDKKIEQIKGKWVKWQARIKEVENTFVGDNIRVHIGCNRGNFFNDGYVYFNSSVGDKLAKYKVGQTIKFEGQLDGKSFLFGFRIKKAELIK